MTKDAIDRLDDFSRGWEECRAALRPIRRMEASIAFVFGVTTGACIAFALTRFLT